jgi:hypothetical protein
MVFVVVVDLLCWIMLIWEIGVLLYFLGYVVNDLIFFFLFLKILDFCNLVFFVGLNYANMENGIGY